VLTESIDQVKLSSVTALSVGFANHQAIFGPANISYDFIYSKSTGLCHFVSQIPGLCQIQAHFVFVFFKLLDFGRSEFSLGYCA
jgi:hypothetical protein